MSRKALSLKKKQPASSNSLVLDDDDDSLSQHLDDNFSFGNESDSEPDPNFDNDEIAKPSAIKLKKPLKINLKKTSEDNNSRPEPPKSAPKLSLKKSSKSSPTTTSTTTTVTDSQLDNAKAQAQLLAKIEQAASADQIVVLKQEDNLVVDEPLVQTSATTQKSSTQTSAVLEEDEEDDDNFVIHPQLEKLLDLLSDGSRVQVMTVGDLNNTLRNIVKDAVQEALQHQQQTRVPERKKAPEAKRVSFKEDLEEEMLLEEDDSPEKQLSNLMAKEREILPDSMHGEKKLCHLLANYADREDGEGSPEYDLAAVDQYLDKVYVLNITGKASELQYKLETLGFSDVQVVDGNSRKPFWDNVWEVAKLSQKREYKKIMILQDNVCLHKDFARELACHYSKFQKKKDWKLIAFSAIQSLTLKSSLDWKYYLETYPELKNHKITDEKSAQKHWKVYGMREKRYSQRGLLHPDTLGGVSGVILNSRIYSDLPRLRKNRKVAEFLLRNFKNKLYATSPLLALNGMNRMVRLRNRHNLDFYET